MRSAVAPGLVQDVRYAARLLRRQPGYAAVAVLTMALGIGATTTLFSVAYGVLARPLPWPEADRLVRVYEKNSETNMWSLSTVDFQAIREQQHVFEAFGAVRRVGREVHDPDRMRDPALAHHLRPDRAACS